MKSRWFLVMMTLIGITLACSLNPNEDPNPFSHTEVRSVAVNPPSGTGSFTLEVTYTVYLGIDRLPDTITCYYVTPAGATMPIGSVSPPVTVTGSRNLDGTQTLALSVSDPGVYTATCKNSSSNSTASAVFGVTEPTPTTQLQPTEQPEQIAFTMYGTFDMTYPKVNLTGGEYVSGEIQINIDPKTGQATGSLRGSGSGTQEWVDGDHSQTNQWNFSVISENLTGSIDLQTGILMMTGIVDGSYNWVSTNCIINGLPSSYCAQIGPSNQFPVKITGTVNLANHTSSGIVDATSVPDYPSLGEWQTVP